MFKTLTSHHEALLNDKQALQLVKASTEDDQSDIHIDHYAIGAHLELSTWVERRYSGYVL